MIEIAIYENNIKQGSLEVPDSNSFPLALTKSISDIKSISKRSGTVSKTFTIPATTNNNRLLKYIYNANVNATGKVACTILSNGMPFSTGYITALSVKERNQVDEYELSFVGESADWVVRLTNKTIRDYDYGNEVIPSFTLLDGSTAASIPAQTVNSTLSKEYINASWVYPEKFDYVYPLVSYGQPEKGALGYSENDFRPDVYVGKMLFKAFEDIGYTLTSDFFSAGIGSRLHTSFIQDNFIQPQSYLDNRSCEAKRTGTYTSFSNLTSPTFSQQIELNTDVTDPGNIFDTVTHKVTLPTTGIYNLSYNVILKLTTQAIGNGFVRLSQSGSLEDAFNVGIRKVSNLDTVISSGANLQGYNLTIPITGANYLFNNTESEIFLEAGEYEVFYYINVDSVVNVSGQQIGMSLDVNDSSSVTFEMQPTITKDQEYEVSTVLPELKVLDVLGGLLNMFNLQFITDSNLRTINIEPKTTLYKGISEGVDYSDKLDVSNQIITTFIDGYKRNLRFKFKEDDNDAWVTNYNSENNDIYGSVTYDLGDKFDEGITDLGTNYFAPTITYDKHSWSPITGCPIPVLWSESAIEPPKSYDFEPRILYYKGLTTLPIEPVTIGSTTYTNALWTFLQLNSTQVPQSFMVDAGLNVSDPVNILYADSVSNGLAKTYYRSDIAIISHKRYISCYMNITPSVFKSISLFKPIYLDHADYSGWYYVNEIKDFQPTKNVTTIFELVKAYDSLPISTPTKIQNAITTVNTISSVVGGGTDKPLRPQIKPFSDRPNKTQTAVLHNGTGNTGIDGAGGVIFGSGLQQQSTWQNIFGNYNYPNNSVFSVGVGLDAQNRQNGLQITSDGRFLVYGGAVRMINTANSIERVQTIITKDGVNEYSDIYLTGTNGG